MKKVTVVSHLTSEKILERMLSSEDRAQFQRWQVIYITALKSLEAKEVAILVGVSRGTVHQWIHRYNHQGPEAMVIKSRGGRRKAHLSLDEEKEFLKSFESEANQGEIITAKQIKIKVEKKLGKEISDDFVYDLLYRHGWRKVSPRPKHPKGDREEQEAFKKTFHRSWRPPTRASTRKTGVR